MGCGPVGGFRTKDVHHFPHRIRAEIVRHITCTKQVILLVSKSDSPEEERESFALGVSPERFGRDIGRPLVVVDHSRHDAAWA